MWKTFNIILVQQVTLNGLLACTKLWWIQCCDISWYWDIWNQHHIIIIFLILSRFLKKPNNYIAISCITRTFLLPEATIHTPNNVLSKVPSLTYIHTYIYIYIYMNTTNAYFTFSIYIYNYFVTSYATNEMDSLNIPSYV